MPCWHYAQLTITVDGRALQGGTRTILWYGPGQGVGENYSESGQTVLELLNPAAAPAAQAPGRAILREQRPGQHQIFLLSRVARLVVRTEAVLLAARSREERREPGAHLRVA
jgi:hypothetical protein